MKSLSVCIPTYEMGGQGHIFLRKSFEVFCTQTYKDFDVIISDHSQNNDVEDLCKEYGQKLGIHYFRNLEGRGSSSANINNAITKATGKLIKILFQDDFLYHENALKEIMENFDMEKDHWLVTACIHTKNGSDFFKPFYPRYNKRIYLGKNTISSPSVLTIKNDHPLLFNESLVWLMDVDYYKRYYDRYNEPKIFNGINVVNRIGEHQVSNIIANRAVKKREYSYELRKYEHGLNFWYYSAVGYMKDMVKQIIGKYAGN